MRSRDPIISGPSVVQNGFILSPTSAWCPVSAVQPSVQSAQSFDTAETSTRSQRNPSLRFVLLCVLRRLCGATSAQPPQAFDAAEIGQKRREYPRPFGIQSDQGFLVPNPWTLRIHGDRTEPRHPPSATIIGGIHGQGLRARLLECIAAVPAFPTPSFAPASKPLRTPPPAPRAPPKPRPSAPGRPNLFPNRNPNPRQNR